MSIVGKKVLSKVLGQNSPNNGSTLSQREEESGI